MVIAINKPPPVPLNTGAFSPFFPVLSHLYSKSPLAQAPQHSWPSSAMNVFITTISGAWQLSFYLFVEGPLLPCAWITTCAGPWMSVAASLPSSFSGWPWLCQDRKDQSTSMSTSNELHFFDSILTYLWRQKKQKWNENEMKNEIWVIGRKTFLHLHLLLYILFLFWDENKVDAGDHRIIEFLKLEGILTDPVIVRTLIFPFCRQCILLLNASQWLSAGSK